MKYLLPVMFLSLCLVGAEDPQPLRVFIRGSAKTHGPGAHDYPRFLTEWRKLLTERGAIADGALRPPTDAELAKTDVLVIYASDATNLGAEDRSRLESFLKRGGGLVALHDSICGTNTDWFANIAGGAKQHGERNWKTGPLKLHFEDPSHPIVRGAADFDMDDEMFFRLRMAPETRVLATALRTPDEAVPQLWVLEKSLPGGRPYRAFVSLQGHWHARFGQPEYERLLLRGIAWAAQRPVDLLTTAPGKTPTNAPATLPQGAREGRGADAGPATADSSATARTGRRREPVKLGPDDQAAFPPAPAGFDAKRENIARGKLETVEYDSKTVGVKRRMVIYTPPAYSKEIKYSVLYLLHGIGDEEGDWSKKGSAEVILDNLSSDKRVVPMIVVMPNGRASVTATARTPWNEQITAFESFEKDLLTGVIPYVESHYAVKLGRENRALAGLSMGGGQSLNFGLKHLETFAWVAGFSSAPNTKPAAELIPNPEEAGKKLKLLWVSCGDQDGLMNISYNFRAYLKEKNVPHIWQVDAGGHTWPVWKNDLYLLAQQLFR